MDLRKPTGRAAVFSHPFAAHLDQLLKAIAPLLKSPLPPITEKILKLQLPSTGRLPFPSPNLVHEWKAFEKSKPEETGLQAFRIPALGFAPADALDLLNHLPSPEEFPAHLLPADDLRFWQTAARWALELLAAQQYIPGLIQERGAYLARWQPLWNRPDDAPRLQRLIKALPPVARASVEPDEHPHQLVESFIESTIDGAVREWHGSSWRRLATESVPGAWLNALFSSDPEIQAASFSLRSLATAHSAWLRQLQASGNAAFRLCLRLGVPPDPGGEWPLDFLLQARDDPSLLIEAADLWDVGGSTFTYLDRRFDNPQERLLTALGYAARIFPPLERSLRERRPTSARLSTQQAYTFLREAAPLLSQSGFGLLSPPWWNKRGARLGARLTLAASKPPATASGLLSRDNLVAFRWEVVLGGETLTREEFEALVRLKLPLVQVRGQWVALNPEEIEAAIAFWKKRRTEGEMDAAEALSWTLGGPNGDQVEGLPVEGVQATGWLENLVDRLHQGEAAPILPCPHGLEASLRPYQERGFSWLAAMRDWGLGACLADDMGLGKTIQAIALLLHARELDQALAPALVICPTSVAGNWQREIQRFAPGLSVLIHHGADRAVGEEFLAQAQENAVVITSFGLARRDAGLLGQIHWSALIVDEAQNIKNPSARQTQAIRGLPGSFRLALTGTPVENRLSELWSILNFLNPGYLGSQEKFRKAYGLPIERYHDPHATQRLKSLVGPLILRRVKTDRAVIQDLPEKMEMKVFCPLTREQATLYQAVVDDSLGEVERQEQEGSDVGRRGAVLAALLRLKQVCDHPALYLAARPARAQNSLPGAGEAAASEFPGRSGKLDRLAEMLEEVFSVGEQALVFTQFASMGELLKTFLQETFGREILFLHGGTPREQRERMVARFQSGSHAPPVFILSLKAGGVGLNLTGANHVFHFDRWWNPAVEDQATDRAFRIGQRRNVQVHKFICQGTLEENIDQMITGKKELAASIISAGENWLTELSTAELRDLLSLRPEAVGE